MVSDGLITARRWDPYLFVAGRDYEKEGTELRVWEMEVVKAWGTESGVSPLGQGALEKGQKVS